MDMALYLAIRLSKEGFGPVQQILATPAPIVLAMLNYSNFLSDVQETAAELNKGEAS